jgi:hypothetical protein
VGTYALKYAQYIKRVEDGLKSNPQLSIFFFFFFSFCHVSGFAHVYNAQEIENLFGEYFQGVHVKYSSQADFVVDDGV